MGRPRPESGRTSSKTGDSAKEFNTHFSAVVGAERWQSLLKPALLQPSQLLALENSFVHQDLGADGTLQLALPAECGCRAFRRAQAKGPYPQPWLDAKSGLRCFYWLDAASLLPPLLLQPSPGMSCLDMCASPGGKSLILAQHLWAQGPGQLETRPEAGAADSGPHNAGLSVPDAVAKGISTLAVSSGSRAAGIPAAATAASAEGGQANGLLPPSDAQPQSRSSSVAGHSTSPASASFKPMGPSALTCNEPDAKRRQRLQSVLQEYLPPAVMAAVRITGHEGDKYWQRCEAETYDRVLIDAPCSSDRHILQQAQSNRGVIPAAHWSVKGCKKIADLQLQLLLAGLRCLKVGGRLVYSTCSISPLENDDVVDRAFARCGAAVQVLPLGDASCSLGQELISKLGAERTKHGVICLPDKGGWGPIYACVLQKAAPIVKTSVIVTPALKAVQADEEGSDDEGEGDPEVDDHEM